MPQGGAGNLLYYYYYVSFCIYLFLLFCIKSFTYYSFIGFHMVVMALTWGYDAVAKAFLIRKVLQGIQS